MHEIFDQMFMNNSIGQWLVAVAIVVGAFAVSHLLLWIIKHIVKKIVKSTPPKIDDIVVEAIEKPLAAVVMLIGLKLAFQELTLPERVNTFLMRACVILLILGLTWFLSRFVSQIISEYVRPSVTDKLPGKRADKQMIPAIKRTVQTIIWGLGIVIALNNSGYDVKALVAGLGLGGLALALAAKDTVTNFFGGLTIFFDKPFRLGDRVRVSGYDGYIVAIGLRSFRLSTLEGTEVVIPSAVIIDNVIENVSREPSRRVVVELGLTYDTTPDQMRRAMEILHEIIAQNPNVENKPTIYFKTFADFSININLIYFIIKGKEVFETQNDVNLAILERFNAEGLNFAFPTQSLYVENMRGNIDVKSVKN
jgi:MscS family membrane protein